MRVTVGWESLRDALQLVLHLIPGKSTQGEPTLCHLTASEGSLQIFASDYDSIVQVTTLSPFNHWMPRAT